MNKRILFSLIILLSSLMASSFSIGSRTFGGSLSFYKDLNADVSVLNISPRFGYFVNSNLMFEIGINHVEIDVKEYNADSEYNDGEQYTTSLGARLFMKNFYLYSGKHIYLNNMDYYGVFNNLSFGLGLLINNGYQINNNAFRIDLGVQHLTDGVLNIGTSLSIITLDNF